MSIQMYSLYSVFVGILIVVFFQCMAALLNPATRRREDIKWGVVSYTVVMFSFATVFTGTTLHIQSISFVDNREFPGVKGTLPPGPLGYQWLVRSTVVGMVNNITFFLNNWLADGLLVSITINSSSTYPGSNTGSYSSSIVAT